MAAYDELLADGPVAAIAGDSAGGALAVSTAVALRDAGIALPDALVAFSPWTDLGGTGARALDPGFEDAVLPRAFLRMAAAAVLGGRDPDDPAATPVTADAAGSPARSSTSAATSSCSTTRCASQPTSPGTGSRSRSGCGRA